MDGIFVGLDVAKDQVDVYVQPTGERFVAGTDDAALATVVARVSACAPTSVVLEGLMSLLRSVESTWRPSMRLANVEDMNEHS